MTRFLMFLVVAALVGGLATYALGSLAMRRTVARSLAPTLHSNPLETIARVAAVLLNLWLNATVWLWLAPWGLFVGAALAALAVGTFRLGRSHRYKTALGWASWLMPMSWPSTALGALVFLAVWISLPWRRRLGVRLDTSTGTIETAGLPRLGFRGGFNLGNFTFLVDTSPTSFQAVGISAHEAGHTLNVAAFGSVWHLLGNGIEQNLWPWKRGADAYGELLAESHRPDPAQAHLRQWC